MKRCAVVLVVLAVACGASLAAQRPSFRSAVELVLLNVTVTGPGGRFVSDLSAEDFQILEDGRPQEVTFFSSANVPLSVSLLIDTSSSMDSHLAQAQEAALNFIAKLRPGDTAEVISFDSRVEVVQRPTNDRDLLETAIRRLRASGATSLYNAVYIALSQLAKRKPDTAEDVRRHVIVVLSDGADTSSLVTFEQVLDTAKRSQTVIYAIALGVEEVPLKQSLKQSDGEFALRQLTQQTGGRVFLSKRPTDLLDVYSQIASELSNQYVLGFPPTGRETGWRRLAVTVRQPNVQARTRTGYYAANP